MILLKFLRTTPSLFLASSRPFCFRERQLIVKWRDDPVSRREAAVTAAEILPDALYVNHVY
jgi:hypothetical protein